MELHLRSITTDDIPEINKLNEHQHFKLENLENCIIDQLAPGVAYGIVKHFAEAIILVNPEVPKITRAKALRELMKIAIFGSKKAGLAQLHCFCRDESVAKLLERKFGFIRTKDIVLVKNL